MSERRLPLRAQIRPFPREAHYPTGWNDPMTFADIRAALTPSINRLMRYYRYVEVDIPDMISHGFMRLWEELSQNPNLLAQMQENTHQIIQNERLVKTINSSQLPR